LKEENVSAKSKLWANENDTSVVSNDGNNQATLNKETNATSIANHAILSDTQVVGLPNNSESNKSCELKRDGVMSDTDYFQSRVTTEWSDSESSDDENDNVNMIQNLLLMMTKITVVLLVNVKKIVVITLLKETQEVVLKS
jgi:hypothetical protein